MNKPEFKLLPCVFCTVGFNCYVAGHKVVSATYQKITGKMPKKDETTIKNSADQYRKADIDLLINKVDKKLVL